MNKRQRFLVFMFALLLAGCGSLPHAYNTQASETVPPTTQITLSSTSTLTQEPSPTFTLTPTATNTPTPTPTLTPGTPTLSADEGYDAVTQLLQTNGGCDLPCFLGITPGKTTWDEANRMFSHFGKSTEPDISKDAFNIYSFSLNKKGGVDPYVFSFYVVNGNQTPLIYADIPYQKRYSIKEIVATLGTPTRVMFEILSIRADGPSDIGTYGLTLFYDNDDIWLIAGYDGIYRRYHDGLVFCPTNLTQGIKRNSISNYVGLTIQPGDNQYSLDDLSKIYGNNNTILTGYSFEEATGVGLETLHADIIDNTGKCYTTPRKLWGGE
jgi:hypothetical protein